MRNQTVRWLLTLSTGLSCLIAASLSFSAIPEARLVGLAMHQETGRNIYIGALHYDELVPRPDNIVAASGPKAMEYRVVARRTSIRSLMGNILLQGELAAGTPPTASTIEFTGDIMAAVQGSLYAGDSLQIRLNKDNSTVASLGGLELARTANRDVADYFLMGWVGEGGPSTAFRDSILSTEIDDSLMSIYSAHTVSSKRLAAINSWAEPSQDETSTSAVVATAIAAVTAATETPATAAATETPATAADDIAALGGSPEIETPPITEATLDSTGDMTAAEPVMLASLSPTREMILPEADEKTAAEAAIEAIDAMEYSQRLANFNTLVLRSVYSHIRYPRAAIRRNIQGTLELDLLINVEGSVLDITIARSSGHSMLDKSAIKAAREAFDDTPLREIDQVAIVEYSEDGEQLIIPIPISFILTE